MENSVDPDQLASQKPADLDLHSFQNIIRSQLIWIYTVISRFSIVMVMVNILSTVYFNEDSMRT